MSTRRARYEIREAKNGEHYVVLVASNGTDLMTSETYDSKSNARRAVEAFQRAVSDIEVTEVEDET